MESIGDELCCIKATRECLRKSCGNNEQKTKMKQGADTVEMCRFFVQNDENKKLFKKCLQNEFF